MRPGLQSVDARALGPTTLRWFGIDWAAHLPWDLAGIEVDYVGFERALPFVEAHYAEIFGARDPRLSADPMTATKRRFYAEADVFAFSDDGKTIGLVIGHPTDWSSYYVRTVALLPAYRGRGFVRDFTRRFAGILREAGVARIDGDIPPVNIPNFLTQLRSGYVPTGTLNSDRWGALVRMTKFLDESTEDVFRAQFCPGDWPRCRDT